MTILVNEYYIDASNAIQPYTSAFNNPFKAYFVEDVNFSNLTFNDIKTIISKNSTIGETVKNFASSLFCDGSSIFIIQPQWDAKYRYTYTGEARFSGTLALIKVDLNTAVSTKPVSGAYIKNTAGGFVPITLGDEVSGITANSTVTNGDFTLATNVVNTQVFNQGGLVANSVYVPSPAANSPNSLICNALTDSTTQNVLGNQSYKTTNGWQYFYNSFIETNPTNGFYYHIKLSVDSATSGKSYCKLFYKNSIVNISLFPAAEQNYYVAQNKDDFASKGVPVVINKTVASYDPSNPFSFTNDKDGGLITPFTINMHGKKLYLEGSQTKYVVVYRKLIDANVADGDGTYEFKIPIGSTMTNSDLQNDITLISNDQDSCYALLQNNNDPVKVLETGSQSKFIVKRNTVVNSEGSGYSNLIYFEGFDKSVSMVLVPVIDASTISLYSYVSYLNIYCYNVAGSFYKNIPNLTTNATNVFKFDVTTGAWRLSKTGYNNTDINLFDSFGDNLINNTYVAEFNVNKVTFDQSAIPVTQSIIPFFSQYSVGGGGNQLLNGLTYLFIGYDKSIQRGSYMTTTQDFKVGSALNGFLKI